MRALVQRVTSARVLVQGHPLPNGGEGRGEEAAEVRCLGEIGIGLLVLLGIHRDDKPEDGDWLIRKLLSLRIFPDDAGKMGRSVTNIGGGLLVVSQFTLFGDVSKGTRPDF